LIPDFTTTTDNDIVIASMTMMATFKDYFDYRGRTGCGFPSVTLLGEEEDWKNMRRRLGLLTSGSYGERLTTWSKLLVPMLDRFIAEDQDLKDFWLSVAHYSPSMSGQPKTFSGWMTAFMYFQTDGKSRKWFGKEPLTLDGQIYPTIEQFSVPSGVIEVPVVIRAEEQGMECATTIVARSVGMEIVKYGEEGTTVQPKSGWWMLEESRTPIQK
jgi:hypothetical protein